MKSARNTMTSAVLLSAFAAFAHGGEEHLKGVVTKIDGMALTVAVEKGTPVVVMTDEKTEFTRGDVKATLKDVVVGDKAVIHAKEHDEKLVAHVVKLAAASKPTQASPDAGAAPKSEKGHDEHKH